MSKSSNLLDRIYRLLSTRARTEKEIRNYLKLQNRKLKIKHYEPISQSDIDGLVGLLKSRGLINDIEFAQTWVRLRKVAKKKGVRVIKSELLQKGIKPEIIEQVMARFVTEESELDLATQALEKKVLVWRDLSALEFREKAYNFLLRRGFEYDIARRVIENYLKR